MTATETVQPGQWLRHLTNAPERLWRYLEEITPDPLGNPDVVVLKFSNGDAERLLKGHTAIVNNVMFDGPPRRMWDISEEKPASDIATDRTVPSWLCVGKLVELMEHRTSTERWVEATLDGYSGRQIVEIPLALANQLEDQLVPGVLVQVVTPPLANGAPGFAEVRVGNQVWTCEPQEPITRGFLDHYSIVEEADRTGCCIVPFVPMGNPA